MSFSLLASAMLLDFWWFARLLVVVGLSGLFATFETLFNTPFGTFFFLSFFLFFFLLLALLLHSTTLNPVWSLIDAFSPSSGIIHLHTQLILLKFNTSTLFNQHSTLFAWPYSPSPSTHPLFAPSSHPLLLRHHTSTTAHPFLRLSILDREKQSTRTNAFFFFSVRAWYRRQTNKHFIYRYNY